MDNFIFLVKADLMLHESTFDKLRDFVKNIDLSQLTPGHYHIFDFTQGDNNISYYSADFCLWSKSQDLIDYKINSGFILMNLATLFKYLNI